MGEEVLDVEEPKTAKKAVTKPNTEAYQAKIAAEREAINALYKRMNELSAKVTQLRSGQSDYVKQRDELRKNVDIITKQMQDLDVERTKLFAEIDESQRAGRDMKNKVQSLKKNLGFQSAEEIDAKVRALERHMMSKRLSVPEENRLIAQIKQLKSSKPLVGQYASMEADANSHSQTAVMPLKIRFDEVREEFRACQQKKRELTDRVRQLIEANQKSLNPARELAEEREQIKKEIALHRQEEARLIDELNAKSREFQAHVAQMQRATMEKRREERRKREVDNEREQLQREIEELEEDIAWSPEYQLTHQTIQYLKKLVDRIRLVDGKASPTTAATERDLLSTRQSGDGEDEGAIYKKYEKEEDYYFAPTKRKGDKKQRKQHAVSLTQPLVHDLSTLADFEKLALAPPLTLEECPVCLDALERKMEILEREKTLLSQSAVKKKQELAAKLEALEARA